MSSVRDRSGSVPASEDKKKQDEDAKKAKWQIDGLQRKVESLEKDIADYKKAASDNKLQNAEERKKREEESKKTKSQMDQLQKRSKRIRLNDQSIWTMFISYNDQVYVKFHKRINLFSFCLEHEHFHILCCVQQQFIENSIRFLKETT